MRNLLSIFVTLLFIIPAIAQTPTMVYDGYPGSYSGMGPEGNLVPYNGKLYYAGFSYLHGTQLWYYDGTGTPQELDYWSGTAHGLSSSPYITPYKGKLYFDAYKQATGHEVTSFDGSAFSLVLDVIPGQPSSGPHFFTELQSAGLLFFAAADSLTIGSNGASNSIELYRYDGTNPPTCIRVNDGSNPNGSQPNYLQALGAYIYFSAIPGGFGTVSKLFSAGVAGAATLAKGATHLTSAAEKLLVGNKIYFTAYEPATGAELYSYDGDTAIRLTDIAPGMLNGLALPSLNNRPLRDKPALYKDAIYFPGSTDGVSSQLYAYNLSTGRTSLMHTINPGGDGIVSNLYVYRDSLFFTANTAAAGVELWMFDGDIDSCALYADIWPGPNSGMAGGNGSTPKNPYVAFTEFKGDLYFKAQDGGHGVELWRIKGPAAGGPVTGVQQVRLNGSISVYPNLASVEAILDVSLQEDMKLSFSLSDMSGRLVYSTGMKIYQKGSNKVGVPMQGLSAGQYQYHVLGERGGTLAAGVITKQ